MLIRKRFYLVVALAGVSVYTGASTGFDLFFRMAYLFAFTVAASLLWSWISLRWLNVSVDRRTQRVHLGDPVEERLTVHNSGSLAKPLLEVEDLSDLPGYHNAVAIGVPAKGFRSWRTQTPARKRGVYSLGPVRVSSVDPFGLFQQERRFGGSQPLVVYPRLVPLPEFAIPPANLTGDSATHKRTHDLTPHASTVRDYAFGDSVSRVHWSTTARMGKLMSKEFELGRASDVWVVVDLHRDVQAGELEESTDEYAVSIAGSLASKYLTRGEPVGVVAYGDERVYLPADTGIAQLDRALEYLARSKTEGEVPLAEVLAREEGLWSYHSTLVVITPSHLTDWVLGLRELTRRRVRAAAVVLDGRSFGGVFGPEPAMAQLEEYGVPAYLVKQGLDLQTALGHPHRASPGAALERPGTLVGVRP